MLGLIGTIEAWGANLDASLRTSLATGSIWAVIIVFTAGVLTSLTPCVYPMIPVVVTYIGGSAAGTRSRAVLRSATYVGGMVVVYAGLGVFASLFGSVFGKFTQKWYVYGVVGVVILLFGLSMLGLWNIQLPSSFQAKLTAGGRKSGLAGPFFMGAVSGVIAAPCTAPVLGTLLLIVAQSQAQDSTGQVLSHAVQGGFLLVVFALGMGLLLFLLGVFSGMMVGLPGTGRWMDWVKKGFGAAMIVLSCWFFSMAWSLW